MARSTRQTRYDNQVQDLRTQAESLEAAGNAFDRVGDHAVADRAFAQAAETRGELNALHEQGPR